MVHFAIPSWSKHPPLSLQELLSATHPARLVDLQRLQGRSCRRSGLTRGRIQSWMTRRTLRWLGRLRSLTTRPP